MPKIAARILLVVVSIVVAFAAGNFSGFYFYPRFFAGADHDDLVANEQEAHDEHADEEMDHVALSEQAFQNLRLELGHAKLTEYWKFRTAPGEVIEVPGKSDLSVSAPVDGVIEQVFVRQGQSVEPTEALLTLRIADEQLSVSQSKLLTTLARQEVVREEIARLEPLTHSGTVSGRAKRDLEYELKQLIADENTRIQEIRARGLPNAILKTLVDARTLADRLTIVLPDYSTRAPLTRSVSLDAKHEPKKNYSIESLPIHPGKSIKRGDALCTLAFHADLYIEGTAFESDLPDLKRLATENWSISAEFGHSQGGGHTHRLQRAGLKLLHINNHVDRISQTFKFYLPLENQVEQSLADKDGRTYLQWKFRPGQRVHLRIPVERWESQVVVPLDAVVIEGPNAFVFAEHTHDEETHEGPGHEGHADADLHEHDDHQGDAFIEFEAVPIHLLHRDAEFAVIANDDQLHLEDRIALNNAFKLHLAMKMQAGGGSAHHHHEH